ncbi:hypothetical protein EVAR_19732_1 [Eumeta japonica]|uniref:Uncharacterized protein n=1 Tax=Eumeta variegata TaxID=151549 RepID=A0A4C1UQI0_EUMVA|nr:hypothetical protein EVAR_19732_1 [Eumeta japonica]
MVYNRNAAEKKEGSGNVIPAQIHSSSFSQSIILMAPNLMDQSKTFGSLGRGARAPLYHTILSHRCGDVTVDCHLRGPTSRQSRAVTK